MAEPATRRGGKLQPRAASVRTARNCVTPQQREARVDGANLARFAASKGCKPKQGPNAVGNTKHGSFPDCNPGWVYSYYLAPGQHADPWDLPSITKSMEEMKSIETK